MCQYSYLITGASGQLGTEWKRALENAGANFTAVDSNELDITDRTAVSEFIRYLEPDVLINCAAYTNVDEAEDPDSANEVVNHAGVRNLAEACAQTGTLLVHYSTDYVFSGAIDDRQRYPNGYPEDAPLRPINAYGKSKLRGEEAVRESGAHHLIIRISWLCGSYGKNFLKTMLTLGSKRDELTVVNDQIGSPTFTFDVVDFTQKLITLNETGIYHLQCNETVSWFDFARMIFCEAGMDTKVMPVDSSAYPVKAVRPVFSKMDTSKLRQKTGDADISITDGIRRVLNEINETDHPST